MNIVIQLPCIVEHYAPHFEDLFSADGYVYFKRFISGLLVSDNKTVEGINRLFVTDPRNQSSFNRFMNRQNFDLTALNNRHGYKYYVPNGTARNLLKICVGTIVLRVVNFKS